MKDEKETGNAIALSGVSRQQFSRATTVSRFRGENL